MIFGGRVEIKDKQKHVYATIDFAQENKHQLQQHYWVESLDTGPEWRREGHSKPCSERLSNQKAEGPRHHIFFAWPTWLHSGYRGRSIWTLIWGHCSTIVQCHQRRKQTKHHCYCLLGSCTLETVSPHNKTSYKEILTIQTGRLNYLSLTHINIVMHHHNTF